MLKKNKVELKHHIYEFMAKIRIRQILFNNVPECIAHYYQI